MKEIHQLEDWKIEQNEAFIKGYKERIEELKSYRKLIKQIPESKLKEHGTYGYILITEFPSEENEFTWSYHFDADLQFNGGGIALGEKCFRVYSKKFILEGIDFEIEHYESLCS